MNLLPRLLGTALVVVLALLAALLAAPLWQRPAAPAAPPAAQVAPAHDASVSTDRIAEFSRRVSVVLSLTAFGLSAALLFSLFLRSAAPAGIKEPLTSARHEIDTLAKLAESSAAQGEELTRERDVRRRAEEDAELKQQLLAQSLDEKIRLGRDLHDGIIQSLYAVGLTLETMRPLLRTDANQAEQRLEDVRASLNAAIRDVRAYITGLAPENLRRASFSRGVALLFEQLRAGRTVRIDINVDDDAAAQLSVEQTLEALQIAREAISNALRHGAASHITLRMHRGDGEVCLLVQDDGRGFVPEEAREEGFGLQNMRARAERLGATLRVTSEPGQGVRVVANFPLHGSSA